MWCLPSEVAVFQDIQCLLLIFDLSSAASFEHLDATLSKFLSVQSQSHSHSHRQRPRKANSDRNGEQSLSYFHSAIPYCIHLMKPTPR